MIHEFVNISIHSRNKYASGDLSALDKEEILNLLNSKAFLPREFLKHSSLEIGLFDQICRELEEEYRVRQPNSSDYDVQSYSQNCHSLARKMNDHLNWSRVCGYVFNRQEFKDKKSALKLTAHSISQDDSGELIELTSFFDPGKTAFIKHGTGGFGIDLKAHRGYS